MAESGPNRRTILIWGCTGAAAAIVGPSVRASAATARAPRGSDLVLRPGGRQAYDRDEWSAGLRFHVPLVYAIAADTRVGFDAERYDNPNLIDGLTDGGVGRPDPRRRRDDVWSVGASLTRPVGRFTELELSWGFTDRASNVDLYAYDRHVVGLTVRVQTP